MQHSLSRYYYKDVTNVLQEKSFVYELMSKVCEYVKGNYTHITNVKYFFDGCTGQYKN